jgi:hypothetical protein
VDEPAIDQLADQIAHAAGRVKMVHVGKPVRVDARQQRHGFGEVGDVAPGQLDAGALRHGDKVHGMVGGAAGRVQSDDAVYDRLLVHDTARRGELVAERGDRQRPLGGLPRQRIAQWCIGVDEGRAGQMKAHDFHQHLVGIGRTVESAGSR